jgi:hypothetical protein
MTRVRSITVSPALLHTALTSATTCMSLLIAGATPARAQVQQSYATTKQAVMVNGVWSAWVQQADVQQTAVAGGINAQVTIRGSYFGAPLMNLLAAALVGKAPEAQIQLATFNITSSAPPPTALKFSRPQLLEIDLPTADAASADPATFAFRFSQTSPETAPAPAGQPAPVTKAQLILQRNFRLDIDSIPGAYVSAVGPLVIGAASIVKGGGYPPLVVSSPALVPSSHPDWMNKWQTWLASGQPRSGTLTFLSADLRTPLLVERFSGLRLASITTVSGRPTFTLTMTGVSLQPAKY